MAWGAGAGAFDLSVQPAKAASSERKMDNFFMIGKVEK
jgi:hypothetical protein